MLKGVSRGVYFRPPAWKNKQFAVTAARWFLGHDESAGVDEDLLWLVVRRGVADPAANENGQIDAVVSLHAAGLLSQSGKGQ